MTHKSWKAEIEEDGQWLHNGQAFRTEEEALQSAKDIHTRYNYTGGYRAVPSDQKPNYKIVDGLTQHILYKREEVPVIRAYLTLFWDRDDIKYADGIYKSIDVDYPCDSFEVGIKNEYAFFDLDAFYSHFDPDDYDDEEGAHADYVKFFERKGNLPAQAHPILKELGLPSRIVYNASSHETIEVETDEEME